MSVAAIDRHYARGQSHVQFVADSDQVGQPVLIDGGRWVIWSRFDYTFVSQRGAPTVTLTIDVDGPDRWRCSKLLVEGKDLGKLLVAGVCVKDLVDAAIVWTADPGPNFREGDDVPLTVFAAVRTRRTRRRLVAADLQLVAATYKAAVDAGDGAPVERVAEELHCARSTAGRAVQQARAAGLLPATTRGKVKA